MTKTPKFHIYSSFVSHKTVRIALTIAALNYLQVKVDDVMNAYVTSPITKKVFVILGNEWDANAINKSIIIHALYVLNSSWAVLR